MRGAIGQRSKAQCGKGQRCDGKAQRPVGQRRRQAKRLGHGDGTLRQVFVLVLDQVQG